MSMGNQPSKTQCVEGKISIVQSIQFSFLRSLGSATSNEANKSVMRRVDHHRAPSGVPFGPNEKSIFCPRTLQAERNFFQVQAIKTGHILIIYRHTGNVLSVSSKVTATAK